MLLSVWSLLGRSRLVVPSDEFMNICIVIEKYFRNIIDNVIHMNNMKQIIVLHIEEKLADKLSCSKCSTMPIVLHLYINIRLHHILR